MKLTYSDIRAWAALQGIRPLHKELELISRLDSVYISLVIESVNRSRKQ